MKESIHDRVVDKLIERNKRVRGKLAEEYAKTKPFRQEPVSSDEMLVYYNMLGSEDIDYLLQKHGREAVNQMIYEFETMKQRRGM